MSGAMSKAPAGSLADLLNHHCGMAETAGGDQFGVGDPHRMEPAVDVPHPEIEEFLQLGKARGDVQMLPQEGLQEAGMVRKVVDDLGGGEAVVTQLTLKIT